MLAWKRILITESKFFIVYNHSYVAGVCLFKINLSNISNQSIADASRFSITSLPMYMPVACKEFIFWVEMGDSKEITKERNVDYIGQLFN